MNGPIDIFRRAQMAEEDLDALLVQLLQWFVGWERVAELARLRNHKLIPKNAESRSRSIYKKDSNVLILSNSLVASSYLNEDIFNS